MLSPVWLAVNIIYTAIALVSGVITNSFIMVVIYMKQRRFLRLSPSNQIQFTMCLSNVFLQCTMVLYVYVFVILPDVNRIFFFITFYLFCIYLSLSSWLTAWFCALYCVALVTFRANVTSRMKMMLPAVVPKTLLITALGCFFFNVPFLWCIIQTAQHNMTYNNTIYTQGIQHYCRITFYTVASSFPVIISITSLVFTVTSLLGHVWRIKHNESSLSDHQLDAYYKACRTMILFVTVFVIVIAAQFMTHSLNVVGVNLRMVLISCLYQCYPSVMSLILILGSSKLKRSLCRIIPWARLG